MSTTYLGIVDEFYDQFVTNPDQIQRLHGYEVESVAKINYSGPILHADVDMWVSDDSILAGISSLSAQGVKVINLSLGSGIEYEAHSSRYSAFNSSSKSAFLAGITEVVAAGNDFQATYPSPIQSRLATSPFVLSVGATTGGKAASYSDLHPGITAFVANGEQTYLGSAISGTSFSAPQVAGLIAQLQTKYSGTLSQAQIRTILEQSSDPVHLTQTNNGIVHDDVYQSINAQKALAYNVKPGSVTLQMQVDAAYELIVDKNLDSTALNYWLGRAQSSGLQSVVTALYQSPDYASRQAQLKQTNSATPAYERVTVIEKVQDMYHLWLGREADDAGLAYWADTVARANETRSFGSSGYTNHTFDWTTVEHNFIVGAKLSGEVVNTFGFVV